MELTVGQRSMWWVLGAQHETGAPSLDTTITTTADDAADAANTVEAFDLPHIQVRARVEP